MWSWCTKMSSLWFLFKSSLNESIWKPLYRGKFLIKLAKNNLENKVRSFCVVAIFLKLLKYFSIIFQPCLIFRDLFPILCRDGNKVLGHRSLVGAERARHHSSSHLLSLYHPRCHAKYHQSQPGPGAAISHIGVIQSRSRTLNNPFIAIFQSIEKERRGWGVVRELVSVGRQTGLLWLTFLLSWGHIWTRRQKIRAKLLMITEKLYQLCTASQNKIYLDCWPKPDFIWLRPELNQGPFFMSLSLSQITYSQPKWKVLVFTEKWIKTLKKRYDKSESEC